LTPITRHRAALGKPRQELNAFLADVSWTIFEKMGACQKWRMQLGMGKKVYTLAKCEFEYEYTRIPFSFDYICFIPYMFIGLERLNIKVNCFNHKDAIGIITKYMQNLIFVVSDHILVYSELTILAISKTRN